MQALAVLMIYALILLLVAAYNKYTHDNFKK